MVAGKICFRTCVILFLADVRQRNQVVITLRCICSEVIHLSCVSPTAVGGKCFLIPVLLMNAATVTAQPDRRDDWLQTCSPWSRGQGSLFGGRCPARWVDPTPCGMVHPAPAASEADDQRRVQVRWLARSLPDLTSVTNNWLTTWSKHMSQFSRTQPLWTNTANSPRMHCLTKRSRSNWIRADLELISIDGFCLFTRKHSTAASNWPCRKNRLHTVWMDVSANRNISEPCPRFSNLEFSVAVLMNRLDADSCVYISDNTTSDQQMLQTALLSVIGGKLGWFFISVTLHLL